MNKSRRFVTKRTTGTVLVLLFHCVAKKEIVKKIIKIANLVDQKHKNDRDHLHIKHKQQVSGQRIIPFNKIRLLGLFTFKNC